jgi:guanylate kinase
VTASAKPSSPSSPDLGRLIVVSGPSGVGKSTIVERLVERLPLEFSVSATTRTPRPGEVDGTEYHFVTREVFETMISLHELLEWAEYNGNLYGTPRRPVLEILEAGRDVLLEIEVQGAAQVKRSYPSAMAIFVAPPDRDTLERRLRGRGDTDAAEVAGRLVIAEEELAMAAELFDHIVVNDDLDLAVEETVRILASIPEDQETS